MTTQSRHSKAFDEGISTLLDELHLAGQWSRPSILLAVHKSKWGQNKAINVLIKKLEKENVTIISFQITKEDGNIIDAVRRHHRRNVVFFFSGFSENRSVYTLLNIQREFFVEEGIRAVFWLTEAEAAALPRFAPDFWAFRHRVVEFAPTRGSKKFALPSGALLWNDFNGFVDIETLKNMAHSREGTLSQIPTGAAPSLQFGVLTTLIHIYWLLENERKLAEILTQTERIAKTSLKEHSLWLNNAKGIMEYHNGKIKKSFQFFQGAASGAISMINLGMAFHTLGKNKDALKQAGSALRNEPSNPQIWHSAGCLHLSLGKIPQAAAYFQKATQLSPQDMPLRFALALCDQLSGQEEAARRFAINQTARLNPLQEAWKQMLLGNSSQALDDLTKAVRQGRITKTQVREDVYLRFFAGNAITETFER